jgi:hypothetical protein
VRFAGEIMRLGRVRELTEKATEYLGSCLDDANIDPASRIAAARCLVTFGMWREDREDKRSPEAMFMQLFGGDITKAAAWLDANQHRIRARLQPAGVTDSTALIGNSGGHDDGQQHAEAEQGREGEEDEQSARGGR